ncbi:MAG: hypothetical protein ACLQU2_18560 [Candidatus Binataceae bacterium]
MSAIIASALPITAASQNLIHAKSKLPESRAIAALVTPELRAVDFAPQRRSEADCCALSGDQQIPRPADALDA